MVAQATPLSPGFIYTDGDRSTQIHWGHFASPTQSEETRFVLRGRLGVRGQGPAGQGPAGVGGQGLAGVGGPQGPAWGQGSRAGWGSGATQTCQHKSVCRCTCACPRIHTHTQVLTVCVCTCVPTRRLQRSLLLHERGLRQLLDGQLLQQLLHAASELGLGILGARGGTLEGRKHCPVWTRRA